MKTSILFLSIATILSLAVGFAFGAAADELAAASASRQLAFALVTDPSAGEAGNVREIIGRVMEGVPRSVLVECDRTDLANAGIVNKYRLSTAPMPLILLVAPNGAIAGGRRTLPRRKPTRNADRGVNRLTEVPEAS